MLLRSPTKASTHMSPLQEGSANVVSERGGEEPLERTPASEKPYSIFTRREKWVIVVIVSFAGMFSPLTANIYFPAIPVMVDAFHKSTELINLTVTIYMVMQGLSPMLWGTLSDVWGRRPMFIGCMVTLTISCVGLALVPTSAYWLLMLLRCLQAFGSASTIALAGGVIGDISTPAERGGFFGFFSVGPMIGPSIGPIIGGALAQTFSWRSIFWFLCIASGICALIMLLIIPETLRSIVGNGCITPPPIYRPLVPVVGRQVQHLAEKPARKQFRNPLLLLTYPDVIILLVFNGTLYSVFYAVTASISTLFEDAYPFLSTTDIGLCFLAIGGGMVIGTILNGKLLDRDYQIIKRRLIQKAQLEGGEKVELEKFVQDDNFPIENARLRSTLVYSILFVACSVGYGWCIHAKVSLAVPLVLQVLIGFTIVSVMNTVQTLLVDLFPSQGSSITNNLIRCSLGAAIVSVVDLVIQAVGAGWTYVIFGAWCIAVFPLLFVELRYGPVWRERRRLRLARFENN